MTFSVSLLFLLCVRSIRSSNIVLRPNNSDVQGSAVGLIYIVGAKINNYQYLPLVKAIQQSFSQPLYVGIPGNWVDGDPSVEELVKILPIILNQMVSEGLPSIPNIFLAGHSLGGSVLQAFTGIYQYNYTSLYPFRFIGQILNAAFITRDWRDNNTNLVVNYSIPTLTIGGELDGMVRPSRIIEQFYIQLIKNSSNNNKYVNNNTLLNYPVVLQDGISHMSFASGNIPPAVWKNDLIPEINETDAHWIVSKYISNWMLLQLNNPRGSFDVLYNTVMSSNVLVDPFIAAFELEGSYWFTTPCNCDPLICQDGEYCKGGSNWMMNNKQEISGMRNVFPQQIMCGFGMFGNVSINVSIKNIDSFHPTYEVHPIHYANIYNTCPSGLSDDSECVLNMSTVTQNKYKIEQYQDTGGSYDSAYEMRHKMKSKQACYEHANAGYVYEDFEICGKINEYAIEYGLQYAPNKTLNRYQNYGEILRIGSDIDTGGGPTWTFPHLNFTQECDNKTKKYYTTVKSEYLYLPTIKMGCKFIPQTECGVHYCKVLSPAHVMEWLYTDGLRFNLSVYNSNITVNTTC